jgi:uncharacterized protein YigA (DUF484 family)
MDRVLKDKILAQPDVILDDDDVMRALISANDQARGPNVIDLRGLAMQRLEERLDRLEDTHKSVIAAAYDNLAGTNQIHRAVLRMMDVESFDAFLSILNDDVALILRVDTIRIIFETRAVDTAQAQTLSNLHPMIGVVPMSLCAQRRAVHPKFMVNNLRLSCQRPHCICHWAGRVRLRWPHLAVWMQNNFPRNRRLIFCRSLQVCWNACCVAGWYDFCGSQHLYQHVVRCVARHQRQQ